MHAWTFEAIGTAWQIDTREPLAPDVRAAVLARIEEFEGVWSRFRPDSLVSHMAERAGTWEVPDEWSMLLRFYADLHEATGGAVDPLVGQTLADLGYDASYSLQPVETPFDSYGWFAKAYDSAIDISFDQQVETITTTEPFLLDVGAAGKGLLVDVVSAIIDEHTHRFTVDASGDMYHGGTAPIRVALEHPLDPTLAIGVAELDPEDALCASATNRRAWGDGLHHVLDARTGRPTEDVIATWVVAPQSCMIADGLATAHFFNEQSFDEQSFGGQSLGGQQQAALAARFPHEYVRMHADGRVEWSPDFPGEIFT